MGIRHAVGLQAHGACPGTCAPWAARGAGHSIKPASAAPPACSYSTQQIIDNNNLGLFNAAIDNVANQASGAHRLRRWLGLFTVHTCLSLPRGGHDQPHALMAGPPMQIDDMCAPQNCIALRDRPPSKRNDPAFFTSTCATRVGRDPDPNCRGTRWTPARPKRCAIGNNPTGGVCDPDG